MRHIKRPAILLAVLVLVCVAGWTVHLAAQLIAGQIGGGPGGVQANVNVDAGGRVLVNPSIVDGNTLFAVSLARFPTSVTLTARGPVGALQTEKSARWTVVSAPAVSNQASASNAALAAGRHVADCVNFSGSASTAVAAAATLAVNLRDGATGAGTVIASWAVFVPATTGQIPAPFGVCGLNLVGTTNTAMTLEWSALTTNLVESVTLTGYDVQ